MISVAIISQGAAGLAFAVSAYTLLDSVRKRRKDKARAEVGGDRVIVQSALELLEPYKAQVIELRSKLAETETALTLATGQVRDLNAQLTDARSELSALQVQVKTMSTELGRPGEGTG